MPFSTFSTSPHSMADAGLPRSDYCGPKVDARFLWQDARGAAEDLSTEGRGCGGSGSARQCGLHCWWSVGWRLVFAFVRRIFALDGEPFLRDHRPDELHAPTRAWPGTITSPISKMS